MRQRLAEFVGKIRTSRSTNARIFRAMVLVGGLMAFVKVASLVKELVVAGIFGTSDARDAFLIAYALPAFAITVVAGAFTTALLPTFVAVRERDGSAAAQRLLSSVLVIAGGFLLVAMAILAALSPLVLPMLAPEFSAEKLALTQELFFVLLPILALHGLISVAGAVMNAGHKFALAALTPLCMPVVTLALLLPLADAWGIHALAWGTTLGFAIEAGILAWALHRRKISLWPRWHGMDDDVRHVIRQYAPMVAGASLHAATTLIDQSMATWLGAGSVATLDYGSKIVNPLLGIAAGAIGTAMLPYFSGMVAANDWAGVRHTLRQFSLLILAVTVPLIAGLILFSEPLVRVLFQRDAFTAADTALVAQTQTMYLLQVPPYLLGMLLVRLFSALRLNQVLMVISGANLVLNVLLNWLLMREFGIAGIALSTAGVYLFSTSTLVVALSFHLRKLQAGTRS